MGGMRRQTGNYLPDRPGCQRPRARRPSGGAASHGHPAGGAVPAGERAPPAGSVARAASRSLCGDSGPVPAHGDCRGRLGESGRRLRCIEPAQRPANPGGGDPRRARPTTGRLATRRPRQRMQHGSQHDHGAASSARVAGAPGRRRRRRRGRLADPEEERRGAGRQGRPRSRSSSPRPTSPRSRPTRCRAGCRCRGRCSRCARPIVKAKVSGDVRQITVREGETVRAGQLLARIDTADLEARLIERQGALESARAQLALAEKTRSTNQTLLKQNFISQNAFDNSESSFNVSQGSVKSARGAGAARAATRSRTPWSPRRCPASSPSATCSPGEKVAFDAPLVTVVDLDGARAAGAGAGGRRARSSRSA